MMGMGAPLDPERRRLYLEAMGIRSWRLRGGHPWPGGNPAQIRVQMEPEIGPEPPLTAPESQVGLSAREGAIQVEEPPALTAVSVTPSDRFDLSSDQPIASLGWEELSLTVAACRACPLCQTRTQTVFGVGKRDAELMLIGEAPGAEEDRQGEPFVGRAGQLLNRMLAAIGLKRDQVYIANILKCRPPGNRDPKPEEAAACRAYLMRQIALVQPRILVSLGRISAQNLLETDEAVGRLRGRWFSFGPATLPLMVTFHPSYLLRSPGQKAKAWQDLILIARRLKGG